MKLKRNIFVFLCSVSLLCVLPGCAGLGDWKFTGLPGRYEVVRVNSRCIRLCTSPSEPPDYLPTGGFVGPYVFQIAWNDDFICAKRADVPDDLKEPIRTSNPSYYIIDVAEETCYGPYNKEEFQEACEEFGVGELDWIATTSLSPKDYS